MSAQQVDNVFALAVGFAIAGCWSLISGTIVALAAFGHHPVRAPARKERMAEDHAAEKQKPGTHYD
jgi:hypothetical protein